MSRSGDDTHLAAWYLRVQQEEDDAMDKIRFLDTLLTERAEWDQVLSQIDEARMSVPGVANEWSMKDEHYRDHLPALCAWLEESRR